MDMQSVTADPRRFTDGESGAVEGLTALERSDRITMMADGLAALSVIMDSAIHAESGHGSTPMVWTPALYLIGMICRDIQHENNALWEEVRPLYVAAKEAAA